MEKGKGPRGRGAGGGRKRSSASASAGTAGRARGRAQRRQQRWERRRQWLHDVLSGAPSGWGISYRGYDELQHLTFAADGTGEMVYGYAQAVRCQARFRWWLEKPRHLRFEYLPTTDASGGRLFTPTEATRFATIGFRLGAGDFPQVRHYWKGRVIVRQRYRLRFDREPFPQGDAPDTQELAYFGWPLEDPEGQAGTDDPKGPGGGAGSEGSADLARRQTTG